MDVETETTRDWAKDIDTETPSRLSLISATTCRIVYTVDETPIKHGNRELGSQAYLVKMPSPVKGKAHTEMASKLKTVKTPAQLNTTSTAAGFYMRMTFLIPPTPPNSPKTGTLLQI